MFKKSVVIKAWRPKKFKLNYYEIVLFTLFICGIIIGVISLKNSNDMIVNAAADFLKDNLKAKAETNIVIVFLQILLTMILFVFFDFIMGLCAAGTPLICTVPVIFGAFCGISVVSYFSCFGLKGLLYIAIVSFPVYAITAATLIKCCCESTKMSLELFGAICNSDTYIGKKRGVDFKNYVINYLVLCVPIIAGVIISTIMFNIFSSIFFI